MIDMFKKLFKKNAKSNTEHIKEVAVPCVCEGSNEHCDLVLQLREKQVLRKNIEDEIDALNKDGAESMFNFVKFLKALENAGFIMEKHIYNYNIYGYNYDYDKRNMRILERAIQEHSSVDIFRITEELRTYKNKELIISEKQRALKAVEDDIKNIKSKLGIE